MEPRNDEQRSTIDQWLAALDDRDWNTRVTVVRMLGELGELTPLEPLLAALSDEDESVRAATVRALGKRGERTPVDRLVVTLSDPSWMVREMAALTLGELGERAPMETLMNILRTEHEDVFVREAARMALQKAHPEVAPLLAQRAVSTDPTQDHSPGRTNRHHLVKSSPAWLIGLAQRFSRLHTVMQEEGDLAQRSDLDSAANTSLSLTPPAPVRFRPSLLRRTAEGVLVALLLLGIGFSWLLLTQKLHLSSHAGAGATPTASTIVSPSGPGYLMSLTVVDGVVDVGTMNSAVYALRASDGGLLWRYNTAGPVAGPNSPPIGVDGIVYVSADVDQGLGNVTGYVYALRASSGTLLWRYTTEGYVYSPTVANGVVYVSLMAGSLAALRASDGKPQWRYALADTGFSGPTIVDGVLYTVAFKYSPDTTASTPTGGYAQWVTAPLDWKIPFKQGGPSSLYALRASNGTVLWHYQTTGDKNNGMGMLAVAEGLVYIDTTVGSKTDISALRASDGSQRTLALRDQREGL